LQFEFLQILKMFWRMRRKVFSNLAKQRLIPLFENPFVFNPVCQAVEREREREKEYIQTTNSEIDVPERRVLLMDAAVLLALHQFVPI